MLAAVRVEDGHQPVGLGKRLDTSGANGREVAGRIVVVPGIGKPSSSCLDDHESEVMRHDVMQVARDSGTLPLHREPDERLLLGLELPGAVGELADEQPAATYLAPSPPGRQRADQDLEVRRVREPHVHLDRGRQGQGRGQARQRLRVGSARVGQHDRQHDCEHARRECA